MEKIILTLFLAAQTVLAAPVPWHDPLYLANGGYWPQRVAITIANDSTNTVAGQPVEISLAALAGARVESLRACRADGVELLYDLRDARGAAKRAGALAADDKLVVPAECAPNGSATLFVYAGNDAAWAVPDYLDGKSTNTSAPKLRVSISEVERLSLQAHPILKPKSGPDWQHRAEVRMRISATSPSPKPWCA